LPLQADCRSASETSSSFSKPLSIDKRRPA
jgi:hypothetical protein